MRPLRILLLIASFLIGTAIFMYSLATDESYEALLQNEERMAQVSVSGMDVSIRRGMASRLDGGTLTKREEREALRLAFATLALRSRPMLALPGTDPDELHEAIRKLSAVKSRIVAVQRSDDTRARVEEGLFPLQFLESLATLEHARLAFLANPRADLLSAYTDALHDAVRSYGDELERFSTSWHASTPEDFPDRINLTGIMERTDTVRMLASMKRGHHLLSEDAFRYRACLEGHARACKAENLSMPAITSVEMPKPTNGDMRTVRALKEIWHEVRGNESPADRIVRISSRCVGNGVHPFFFSLALGDKNHPHRGIMRNLSDMYFVRLKGEPESYKNPFISYLRSEGVSLLHIMPFAYYSCPESGRDLSRALSLLSLAAYLERHDGPTATHAHGIAYLDEKYLLDRAAELLLRDRDNRELESLLLAAAYETTGFAQYVSDMSRILTDYLAAVDNGYYAPLDSTIVFNSWSGYFHLLLGFHPDVLPHLPGLYSVRTPDSATTANNAQFSTLPPEERAEVVRNLTLIEAYHEGNL